MRSSRYASLRELSIHSPIIKYSFSLIIRKASSEMISALVESGIVFYEFFQVLVAFIAIVLAVTWKKYEFLAGLSFLFLYAIVEMIDVFVFTIAHIMYLDVAQFGFILLAIIFFIIGMHPSWSPKLVSGMRERDTVPKSSRNESLISILRKL